MRLNPADVYRIVSGLAILAVVACGQRVSRVPLREDPELASRIADQGERTKRFESARDMSEEHAEALERRIILDPTDFDARWQLVI